MQENRTTPPAIEQQRAAGQVGTAASRVTRHAAAAPIAPAPAGRRRTCADFAPHNWLVDAGPG